MSGDMLCDGTGRAFMVVALLKDSQGDKVMLERLDRRPREQRLVIRPQALVDMYSARPKVPDNSRSQSLGIESPCGLVP